MVSWQTLVRLAFEEANRKGATFEGIDKGGQFLGELADYWNNNKDRLKQLTEEQARRELRQVVDG